ncbi:MAG: TonB C-terminal domain-containing protein [Campylobacterota bacterium]|nr:TonB C-terminal domain-containing protein [Campylobacterota bacterium]
MDNNKNFILSAVIAFFLYFLFIFIIFFYSQTSNIKKIDAISKPTVLQLDVILDKPKVNEKKVLFKENTKDNQIAKKVVKKSTSTSVKKRSNLKSLFSNVKTSAKKVTKRKVSNVKKSSISSRFKSKFEKERKTDNLKVSKLVENKQSKQNKNIATESKNESDPYFSKIYQILSNRWNPTVFYNDLNAKVLVFISSNGRFSYQFVQYSNNIGFDNQLQEFLDSQSLEEYPISPNDKSIKIEILFQSKG